MTKKIKNFIVTFENCESVSVPLSQLWSYSFKCTSDNMMSWGCGEEFYRYASASYAEINISKFSKSAKLHRLISCSDITHIIIELEDGVEIKISVPWSIFSFNEWENDYQTVKYDKDLDELIIIIKKKSIIGSIKHKIFVLFDEIKHYRSKKAISKILKGKK